MLLYSNDKNKSSLSRHEKAGKIFKIYRGIYTSEPEDIDIQIKDNLFGILSYLQPGAVVSHISALKNDLGVSNRRVFLTVPSKVIQYKFVLGNIEFICLPGPGPLTGDKQIPQSNIYISSRARLLLECLESDRSDSTVADRIPPEEVIKKEIQKLLSSRGTNTALEALVEGVNAEANGHWNNEYKRFLALIGSTVPTVDNRSSLDLDRVKLFENLAIALTRSDDSFREFVTPESYPLNYDNQNARYNLSFFASYFSNLIEGTDFPPEEAKEIVDNINPHHYRPKDSHDIKSLHSLYFNRGEMNKVDTSAEDFIQNIKHWHYIFCQHETKELLLPGRFKDRVNSAGNTIFTLPHLVEGTMRKAWEIGRDLKNPFDLAIYRALTTVSIHPFIDGNGRITRLAASNVMARNGMRYFVIPNVFREDYMLAMRAFSDGNPTPAIRMFTKAMQLGDEIDWTTSWDECNQQLVEKNAFLTPDKAKWGLKIEELSDEDKPLYSPFGRW